MQVLFLALLCFKEQNIFTFFMQVLFLALLHFKEQNIFTFFMPFFWLCYALRNKTYLPFSCLVSGFVTLWGTKHICLFHALFLALLCFEEGNIFHFFMILQRSFFTASYMVLMRWKNSKNRNKPNLRFGGCFWWMRKNSSSPSFRPLHSKMHRTVRSNKGEDEISHINWYDFWFHHQKLPQNCKFRLFLFFEFFHLTKTM